TIAVSGMVTDSEQFWVDGRMYPGQGDFEVVVSLMETSPQGRCNIVLVEAEDEAGNTAEVVLHVDKDSWAPLMHVDVPEYPLDAAHFILRADLTDTWGISHVVVEGTRYPWDGDDTLTLVFPLRYSENSFHVKAVDLAGNEVEQVVIVQRAEPEVEEDPSVTLGMVGIMTAMVVVGLLTSLGVSYFYMHLKRE
ncbi:MAG: hypothetical protein KAS77_08765, partial [Thermoplasmata archaeon]|nr:hypothetical protein [Thermoplasmata archaeon]